MKWALLVGLLPAQSPDGSQALLPETIKNAFAIRDCMHITFDNIREINILWDGKRKDL